MHQRKRLTYSAVINVSLGIHSVLTSKTSFLQPKMMEELLKFLPTTFITKDLNGIWGD